MKQQLINGLYRVGERLKQLQGGADPLGYVLSLFFWKVVSDRWFDHRDQAERDFHGASNWVSRRLARERFKIPPESEFSMLIARQGVGELGKRINAMLRDLERANEPDCGGLFEAIDFCDESSLGVGQERNLILRELLQRLSESPFDRRISELGTNRFASEVVSGTLDRWACSGVGSRVDGHADSRMARLLARLLPLRRGETVCDPFCGTGEILLQLARESSHRDFTLHGQVNDPVLASVCQMRMIMEEVDRFELAGGHSIREPAFTANSGLMQFDLVVGNLVRLPRHWGQEIAEHDPYHRFARGVPPKARGEYAYLLHMLSAVKTDGGRVAVLAPAAMLSRQGVEQSIRQQLVDEQRVAAVIRMPRRLWPAKSLELALVLFDVASAGDGVLMVDGERLNASEGGEFLEDSGLEDALLKLVNQRSSSPGVCRLVNHSEVAEKEYDLSVDCYLKPVVEAPTLDLSGLGREIANVEVELAEVRQRLKRSQESLEI